MGSDAATASDASAIISDNMVLPYGWLANPSSNGPWTLTDSGTITYTVTFTNAFSSYFKLESIANTATLKESDSGQLRTAGESVATSTDFHPSVSIEKSAPEVALRGSVITYDFVVKNTGDAPLTDVSVVDSLGFNQIIGPLAVGATYTFSKDYQTDANTPADLENTATVHAFFQCLEVNDQASASTTIVAPQISIEKSGPETALVGSDITWSFNVTNTGDVALTGVSFTDQLLGISDQSLGPLEVGGSFVFTRDSVAPDAPGTLVNEASVIGTCDAGTVTDSASAQVTITSIPVAAIEIEKSGPASDVLVGGSIEWSFVITNTGTMDLTNVMFSDPVLGIINQAMGDLAAGDSMSFTRTSTAPSEPGTITNVAYANATAGDGSVTSNDEFVVNVINPSIEIVKTAANPDVLAGGSIEWDITVTNTGDVTLPDVVLTDVMASADPISVGDLAPGQVWTTTLYTTAPSSGEVTNDAIVGATVPIGITVEANASATVTVLENVTCNCLIVSKTGPTSAEPGQTVTWYYSIYNCIYPTGPCISNLHISDVMMAGDKEFMSYDVCSGQCIGDDHQMVPWCLYPNEFFNYSITVTIPDCWTHCCNGDWLNNTVNVTGCCHGNKVMATDSWSINVLDYCSIKIFKWADKTEAAPGEDINYSIMVKNTGLNDLCGVKVWETLTNQWVDVPCFLEPCQSAWYNFTYTVPACWTYCHGPQSLENEVRATAYCCLCEKTVSASDSVSVDIVYPAKLFINKEANVTEAWASTQFGNNQICYTITVANCGPVPITCIHVQDTMLCLDDWICCLLPCEKKVYTFETTVPCDWSHCRDGDYLTNTASATGYACDQYLSVNDTASVLIHDEYHLVVMKTAPSTALAGETIMYNITVANAGSKQLTYVDLEDDLLQWNTTQTGQTICCLDPCESMTFQMPYTIPDYCCVRDRELINTVFATAWARNIEVTAQDCTDTTVLAPCSISVNMTGPCFVEPGQDVTFNVTLENTGIKPMVEVCVCYWIGDDEKIVLDSFPLMMPGEIRNYQINYTVPTGCDQGCFGYYIDFGACAKGECYCLDCNGREMWACDSDEGSMWVHACCDLNVTKTGPTDAVPGESIEWNITVQNAGLKNLTCVEVCDDLTGFYQYISILAPGESMSWTLPYTVPADWTYCDNGDCLTNTVYAKACCCECQQHVEAKDCWTVHIDDPVSLIVTKERITTEPDGVSANCVQDMRPMPGDTVTYLITVSERGYKPVSCINVSDEMIGWCAWIDCLTCCHDATFTVSYTIPYDWNYCDNGEWLNNTVTATGWACGEQVSASGSASVLLNVDHIIQVTKTGPEEASPGDAITYDVTVRNVGKLPLCNIQVADVISNYNVMPTSVDGQPLRPFQYLLDVEMINCLDPCETYSFTVNFTVPADWTCMNGCELFNVASVTAMGSRPCETVCDSDVWVTDVVNIPCSIEVTKCGPLVAVPGQCITYLISVTNPNCKALSCVKVVDETIGLDTVILCIEPFQTICIPVEYTVPCDWSYVANGDSITNEVQVSGYCCSHFVTDMDWWVTQIYDPVDLRITKTSDHPDGADPGDTIMYTITVWNAGSNPMSSVCVKDDMLCLFDKIECLMPGESRTYVINYTVCADWTHCCNGDWLNNTACTCGVGVMCIMDHAEACVSIPIHDDVSVRIWKSEQFDVNNIRPGDVLTFNIEVRNTGILPLAGVHAVDVVGYLWNGTVYNTTILDETICCLESCTSVYYQVSFTVPSGWCCNVPLWNTHTVTACALIKTATGFVTEQTSYEDTHNYTVLGWGQLQVVKTGPEEVWAGTPIDYSITVTNIGECTLYCVKLVDGVNSWPCKQLDAGQSFTVRWIDNNQTLPCNGTAYELTNAAVATASPCPCGNPLFANCVTAEGSWTTLVKPHGAIDLDVSVRGDCCPGGTVYYDVSVTNTGMLSYTGFYLSDEVFGVCYTNNDTWAPGAVWSYTYSYQIPSDWTFVNDGKFLKDTFTVDACVFCQRNCCDITDSVDTCWMVCGPWVQVDKIAMVDGAIVDTVRPGDLVTYQVTVTNVGEHTLTNIWISDRMNWACVYVPCLESGESYTFNYTYQVSPDWSCCDGNWLNNTVYVSGMWNGGCCCEPRPFHTCEELDLMVANPFHLMIWKTDDAWPFAMPGQTVTYTITVFNAGTKCVTSVYVDDDMLGLHDMIPCLEPCQSVVYTREYTIPNDWSYCANGEYLMNNATATGLQACQYGCHTQTVTASDVVYVYDPCDIRVTIDAPTQAHHGDTITYMVTVSNVGMHTACGLKVYDCTLGIDEIIWCLEPCQSVTFTRTITVPPCDTDNPIHFINNTVYVCGCCCAPMQQIPGALGQPESNGCCHVFAEASWSVMIVCGSC